MPSRLEQVARNNAIWCDTVCRTHGAPGEFRDSLWMNRHPVPPFYSNVVTVAEHGRTATYLECIEELLALDLPDPWSVKDSFHTLDLRALGFQAMFGATWLWRRPSPIVLRGTGAATRWHLVRSALELEQWETAWSGDAANRSSAKRSRLFLPELLDDPEIAFIAGCEGDMIVAGAIVNRTADVVGLSNVFVPSRSSAAFWAGCVATAQQRFPRLPLVGYGRGSSVARAEAVGFKPVHDLRVWIHCEYPGEA